ncbi:MAG: tetratricopeptide repeat protein, partial [Gemmataceae bacterium]|nr:tetratricopeptide repeat protein [Gemmataceae bacterium]
MTTTPHALRTPYLVLGTFALLAAAPAPAEPAADLVRRANSAFVRGDAEAADALYQQAAERTADPGLVAFNRAALLARLNRFAEAEAHYARALDDGECPPGRAARGWFDRGTCRLRAATSAAGFRAAAACFERCLDLHPADEALKADARHNLELAKLLWAEANKKAAKQDAPNDPPRDDFPEPQSVPPGGVEPEGPSAEGPDPSGGPNGRPAVRPGQAGE